MQAWEWPWVSVADLVSTLSRWSPNSWVSCLSLLTVNGTVRPCAVSVCNAQGERKSVCCRRVLAWFTQEGNTTCSTLAPLLSLPCRMMESLFRWWGESLGEHWAQGRKQGGGSTVARPVELSLGEGGDQVGALDLDAEAICLVHWSIALKRKTLQLLEEKVFNWGWLTVHRSIIILTGSMAAWGGRGAREGAGSSASWFERGETGILRQLWESFLPQWQPHSDTLPPTRTHLLIVLLSMGPEYWSHHSWHL